MYNYAGNGTIAAARCSKCLCREERIWCSCPISASTTASNVYSIPSTLSSRGFMTVTIAVIQRPGMGPTQPSSPTKPALVQPAITPAAPLLTVQTFDTSNALVSKFES